MSATNTISLCSGELSKWIDKQGDECWWSVDGDPILTGLLDFPCPGDELSSELGKIDKPLLLFVKDESLSTKHESVTAEMLDEYVTKDEDGNRLLQLCWKHRPEIDWILVEDEETSERQE